MVSSVPTCGYIRQSGPLRALHIVCTYVYEVGFRQMTQDASLWSLYPLGCSFAYAASCGISCATAESSQYMHVYLD